MCSPENAFSLKESTSSTTLKRKKLINLTQQLGHGCGITQYCSSISFFSLKLRQQYREKQHNH